MTHERRDANRRERGRSLPTLRLGLLLVAALLGGSGAQRATACVPVATCVENIQAVLAVPITMTADAGKCSVSGLNPTPTSVPFSDQQPDVNCLDPSTFTPGITLSPSRSDGLAVNDPYPVGTTTIDWSIFSNCTGTVHVTQTVTITVPPLGFATGSATSGAGAGKAQLFPTDAGKCSASLTLTPPATTGGCGTVTVTGARSDKAALTAPYPLGQTTITWTATDGQGTQATTTQDITVVDQENPVFSNCPPTGTTAIATCTTKGIGALVNFTPLAATDNCSSPTVSSDHQPGSFFAPGNTTVTAAATDAAGNSATCPFTVSVAYQWSGVLQPINPGGSSVFKLDSTVPVAFQLTGPSACVATLSAMLSWTKVSSSLPGPVNKAVSTSAATTGNLFRYTSGQYLFNWSTKGLTAGTYQLQIDLGDGVTRTVTIGLR